MTPHQRKTRNALDRAYLADLRRRVLLSRCPACGAPRLRACVHLSGPRRGQPMAGYHGSRSDEANRAGHVKGPVYWRSRRSR